MRVRSIAATSTPCIDVSDMTLVQIRRPIIRACMDPGCELCCNLGLCENQELGCRFLAKREISAKLSSCCFYSKGQLRTPLTLTSIGTVILEKFVQGSAFTVFKKPRFHADALNVVT